MLESLNIRNVAIIDNAEIRFKDGLNIISGETGAGKSIVIEAISLLLGSRVNTDLIRSGCDEAVIEGLFDISKISWIAHRLERLGFDGSSSELLVKRTINRAGRHRIHVNGQLATLSILQELCEGLVDLCGQHEHQSLLKHSTQLELLDRYGKLTEEAKAVSEFFTTMRGHAAERAALEAAETERSSKADFLKFQIDELRESNLEAGEDEALHAEKLLLQSAESRAKIAESVRNTLDTDEDGCLSTMRAALLKLRSLNQLDERIAPVREGLERAVAEAEEASLALTRYMDSIDLDPERMAQTQERLSLLADLRRKYGSSVTDMIATLSRLETELSTLGRSEDRLREVSALFATAREELQKLGTKLSHARRKAADLLATSVTAELKDLKMGEARFLVELSSRENVEEWSAFGADFIAFVIQTNRGEPARPLGKIASGGELSRLMLAIRRVIADRGGIGVYLFDEIDAGIGGQTAFEVGRKLKSVAAYNQVICITHLPQVASFADHHLVVQKSAAGRRTVTQVIELGAKERQAELARMLGGPQLTRKSLENAAEMLDLAR